MPSTRDVSKALMVIGFLTISFGVISMIAVNVRPICTSGLIPSGGSACPYDYSPLILPAMAGIFLFGIGALGFLGTKPPRATFGFG